MAKQDSRTDLLTPDNCAVIFIDHQPQMLFGVESIDRQTLINNVLILAEAARIFKLPVILSSVETESFSGYIWPPLLDVFPGQTVIERSSMNSWDDSAFVRAVKKTGRKKLVMAALWTEVCLTFPALSALKDGYDIYAVEDASGGTTPLAHKAAMRRIEQAGGVPVTALQVLLEFQRDWAINKTYDEVADVLMRRTGAYGTGIEYASTMVHKRPQSRSSAATKLANR